MRVYIEMSSKKMIGVVLTRVVKKKNLEKRERQRERELYGKGIGEL